ncbi:hypothetical protein [Psychrobacter sp.]|uniref:hypothetical protein n=1 Tax=Psychrobacter sp. TaxID=56811 RepID=UPI003561A703
MIQYHYKSVCGTKTYSPVNKITVKDTSPVGWTESKSPTVIDDLHNSTGETFNVFFWSNSKMPLIEFFNIVLDAVGKVEGFDYIDVDHLIASDLADGVQS